LDEPILQNLEKPLKNPRFENFGVPLKIAQNCGEFKFQNLFIAGKPRRIFGQARPSKSQDTAKTSCFENFLGSLKIVGNCG
jgi:hypothetical protein